MTTTSSQPQGADGRLDKRWQGLAPLSGRLMGLSDDAEVLRVAMTDILDVLGCDGAQVVLHPFGGHPRLVATVGAGLHNGAVRVEQMSRDEGLRQSSGWSFSVPLAGSSDAIGTLTVVRRSVWGRTTTKRLTSSFALLLASALVAVRSLEVERSTVEATYRRVMLDGLTSLGSRSLLVDRGDRALRNARDEGKVAALVLFDADDFKRINDTLGHHAGDRVLAEFGLRLRRGVRAGDLAVRLGGDEFAVLTSQLKCAEEAELLAARLLQTLAVPIAVDDIELSVRASAGIAVYAEDGDNVRDLLRAADLAMYAAKGLGSGLWQRYSPSTQALADRWSTLAEDLRRDSLDEQLVLHYQPQVDAWSGQITGFESLARWEHPQLGLLPPSEFILLAERAGLMSRLTTAVLGRALADHARLQEIATGCSVSVNISARNLLGRGLVSEVARLLAEHGVPAEQLTIEVAEPPSGVSPGVTETLTGLGRLGCRVSVSEFGSGSSSLMALSRYEGIRELKLDAGLVADLLADPAAERLVRAIIGTAHALDVRVVAEGVESPDMVTHLRDLGCDLLQGYHVRPPAVLDEVRHWADAWQLQRDGKLGLVADMLGESATG
jgi:diguanylate cyclase (GGDEF)-like protein